MRNLYSSIVYGVSSFLFLVSYNVSASESLSYSGRLVNPNGSPVAGPVDLKVELAYSNTPGSILCSQDFTNVILSNGVFHLKVNFDCGVTTTLSQVLSQVPVNQSAAIRVTDVTHAKAYSFQALHAMPFAKISETARQLVQMGASDGQVLKWSNAASKWEPGAPGSSGTVTNVTATAPLAVSNGGTTPALTIAKATTTTDGYLSAADWTSFNTKTGVPTGGTNAQYLRGDNSWQTLDTSVVPESGVTNLYFSNARVLGVPLTGFVAGPGVIVATDTVLQAMEKTQGQINAINTESAKFLVKNATDSITGVVTVASPTGFLRLIDPPAIFTDATNMAYVDSRDDLKVNKAGDVMTGDLTVNTAVKLKGAVNSVSLKAHATTSAYNFIFPQTAGTSGYVLSTDGNGNTSWVDAAVSSGSIVDGSIVDADINATAAIAQSKIANLTTDLAGKEPTLANPNDTTKYYRGDKTWQTLNTTAVTEAANLYFTNARVLGVDLAGLNTGVAGPIAATDTVLGAFGKLQNQITTVNAKGQWEKNVNDIYYNAGKVGIGTNAPGSALEVKGTLRLAGSNSGYVGLAPATDAGSTTYTLPAADGSAGQLLKTNGAGVLSWVNDNTGPGAFSGAINKAVVTDGTGALGTSATTATELGYVAGVTSSIQTQLNAKQSTTLASGNILVGNGSNVATAVAPSSDVSMTDAGAFTVTKLQGNAVATTAPVLGSFLKWDNVLSQWAPTPLATCSGANQVMHYILLTDTWSCDTLNIDNLLPTQTANSGKVLTTNGTTASWQTPAGVTGSGTTNYLPKFTAASTLGDSIIFDNGTKVGVGTNAPVNTLSVLAPYSTAQNSGSAANGGFRLMNTTDAVVLDMGIGINTTAWLQARDPANYATKKNLLLNPVGGHVTIGGRNEFVSLSTNTTNAANGVMGIIGTDITSASSYGVLVLANNRTTPAVGDTAGELRLSMNNNAGWRDMASITTKAEGAGGANGFGGNLILSTKADNINVAPYERMRITSNGNVGINSSTPEGKLVVSGGAGGNYAQSSAASYYPFNSGVQGNAFVEIINTANGYGSPGSFLGLKTTAMSGTPNQRAYVGIAANMGAANYTPNIVIGHQTGATAYQERLRIDASGNVGIGTTTPAAKLDVATGSVTADAPIFSGTQMWMSGTTTFTAAKINITDISSAALSKLLDLQVGGVSKFSVDKTGKVTGDGSGLTGITAAPAGASGQVQFNNTGALGGSSNLFWDNTNGRLGLGTSTPWKTLDVVGNAGFGANLPGTDNTVLISNAGTTGSSAARLTLQSGTFNSEALFNLTENGSGSSQLMVFTRDAVTNGILFKAGSASTNIPIIFNQGPTERMRIDSTGNIGIGTTTPGTNTKLNVAGQIKTGSASITTGAVDWVSGNSITTSFDCGTNITLANLRDGGSYTLVVTGTGTTQCTFSTSTTGDDAATVSYRFKPANGVRTASSHTVYSLLRIGTIVYVSWISGF